MALPSGFTATNEVVLFEILEIPFVPTGQGYLVSDGFGTIRSATTINPSALIRTDVETLLAAMSAEAVTRLVAYITRWEAIGTKTMRQEGGSIGDVSGVTLDYREERAMIRERVKNLVPVYRQWEIYQRNQQAGPGISRGVLR
jgi:hypothetical protein